MDGANGVSTPSNSSEAEEAPAMVIAKYAFEGRNNDELSFAKNDIILVTQRLEGGWWEGSLNGRVGWFPTDFVGIVKSSEGGGGGSVSERRARGGAEEGVDSGGVSDAELEQSRFAYRNEILGAYVKREQEHLESVERLHHTLLNEYVASSGALSEEERSLLASNLAAIIDFSRHLLLVVEHQLQQRSPGEQWVGKAFLDGAQELYPLMEEYCERHCLAVELVQRRRAELEKALAEHHVELNELVAAMSQVFRHVKQYAGFLQEVERNTNEAHADRGNLQRACVVYRELYEHCEFVRKQKEAQMEFINCGALQAEFGPEWRDMLGRPMHFGTVSVHSSTGAWLDRCIVVFSQAITLWEAVSTGTGYVLRQRIGLDEVAEAKRDDAQLELRLRINGASSKDVRLRALTREDYHRLVNALGACGTSVILSTPPTEAAGSAPHSVNAQPPRPPVTQHSHDSKTSNFLRLNHELEMILPEGPIRSSACDIAIPCSVTDSAFGHPPPVPPSRHDAGRSRPYSGWALRPVPATRRELPARAASGSQGAGIKLRKGLTQEEQEDAQLLKLVDGYFAVSAEKNRHSGNQPCHRNARHHYHDNSGSPQPHAGVRRASSYPDEVRLDANRPQLIVADDEKLFVEERGEGGEVVVKEKSLVDTVYSLKDRLESMQKEFAQLSKELEKEQRARRRLEDALTRRGGEGGDEVVSPVGGNLALSTIKPHATDKET